jgi:hypothetical protein
VTQPNREQFTNAAQTTLNGALDNSQTNVVVTSGAVFPSVGNFRVIVESEIMLATARSSNTLTVVRGYEGTSAVSHADTLLITHILTADAVDRMAKDNVELWGYRPPLAKLVADDGSTLLTSSDFGTDNASDVTLSDQVGTMLIRKANQSNSDSFGVLYRSAPSAPYSYIVALSAIAIPTGDGSLCRWGFGFRQNSSTKFLALTLASSRSTNQHTGSLLWSVTKANSPTSLASNLVDRRVCHILDPSWIKLENDGTTLKFFIGDGVNWIQVASEAKTTHFTTGPDQLALVIDNRDCTVDLLVRLLHWSRLT